MSGQIAGLSFVLRIIAVASALLVGVLLLSIPGQAQVGSPTTPTVRIWRLKSEVLLASPSQYQVVVRKRARFLCRLRSRDRIQIRRIVGTARRGRITLVRATTRRMRSRVRPLCESAFEALVPGNPGGTPTAPTPTPQPTPQPTPRPTPPPTVAPGGPSLAGQLSITIPARLSAFYGQALQAIQVSGTCNPSAGSVVVASSTVTAQCLPNGTWSASVNLGGATPGFYDLTAIQGEATQGRRILIRPSPPCSSPSAGVISVRSAAELDALRSATSLSTGETFIVDLCADIDLAGLDWEPLPTFTRVFEGNGFTISHLTVQPLSPPRNNVGLFTQITGVVRNIALTDALVQGGHNVGILAGGASAELSNISTSGEVRGLSNVGGVFGSGIATLADISADVTVRPLPSSMGWQMGGISGVCLCEASNVRTTGLVKGLGSVGGLFGLLQSSTVRKSFSQATVEAEAGGLPSSTPPEAIGGIAGIVARTTIEHSYAEGDVSAAGVPQLKGTGGLIGITEASVIRDTYSIGQVTGTLGTAGLVGLVRPYAHGSISIPKTLITSSYSASSVSVPTLSQPQGGVVGIIENLTSALGELEIQSAFFLSAANPTATQGLSGAFKGIGVSDLQLRDPSTVDGFSSLIWEVGEQKYPRLRGLPNEAVLSR